MVKTIVFQQLSGTSATAIYDRVVSVLGGKDHISHQKLLSVSFERLKDAGLSRRKVESIKGLARAYLDKILQDEKTLLETLLQIKGVVKAYNLSTLPTPKKMEAITEHWRPYRSLASYYMYRVT